MYPYPSGLIFGSHIPGMFRRVVIFKELFCVLSNECFENECDLFILDCSFISFAMYARREEKTL